MIFLWFECDCVPLTALTLFIVTRQGKLSLLAGLLGSNSSADLLLSHTIFFLLLFLLKKIKIFIHSQFSKYFLKITVHYECSDKELAYLYLLFLSGYWLHGSNIYHSRGEWGKRQTDINIFRKT